MLSSGPVVDVMEEEASVGDAPVRTLSAAPEAFMKNMKNVAGKIEQLLAERTHRLHGFEVTDVQSLFQALDRDGDGLVTKECLVVGCKKLHIEATREELECFFDTVDIDEGGTLKSDELESSVKRFSEMFAGQDKHASENPHLVGLRNQLMVSEVQETDGKPRRITTTALVNMTAKEKDTTLDVFMTCLIMLNALTIGASMDYDFNLFIVLDVMFTSSFIVEVILKWRLVGFKAYFASRWNWLDFSLIIIDVIQIILGRFVNSNALEDTPPASMFRVARLLRLIRLMRMIRLDAFEDLIAMISGMIGGMGTLIWSVLLFLMIVYITSLLFREFFGSTMQAVTCDGGCNFDIKTYFSSVPRSMLTVFRYFFGDFTTIDGMNMLEAIQLSYGTVSGVFVCILFFIITIGVFNVIAAIFVESTLMAANALTIGRKTERMNDPLLWSSRITILVRKLFEHNGTNLSDRLSESVDEISSVPVMEENFQSFIKDEAVIRALDDLEIESADHKYLFDILDNDNTGSIFMMQLVDGVRRLRGDPRRSDIIAVDLMVRAIQEQNNMLVEGLGTILDRLGILVRLGRGVEMGLSSTGMLHD